MEDNVLSPSEGHALNSLLGPDSSRGLSLSGSRVIARHARTAASRSARSRSMRSRGIRQGIVGLSR